MSFYKRNENLWNLWGYPDDPEWDGKTYDIGYSTESGCAACVASGLTIEDAHLILDAVQVYLGARIIVEALPPREWKRP